MAARCCKNVIIVKAIESRAKLAGRAVAARGG